MQLIKMFKRWHRRWNYWWSDSRHEPFIAITRAIGDFDEMSVIQIRQAISDVSDHYAYHHTDLAYDIAQLMGNGGLTFTQALDRMNTILSAEFD
jgi:hypothetical protein